MKANKKIESHIILDGTELFKSFICVLSAKLHELEPLVSDTDDRKTHEKYDNN